MIDTNKTKTLMQASERLHKLNMKYKALEIEESVFVVNKQDMIEKKLKISADIRETLCLIDDVLWEDNETSNRNRKLESF